MIAAESLHRITRLFGDRGIPATWRHVNGVSHKGIVEADVVADLIEWSVVRLDQPVVRPVARFASSSSPESESLSSACDNVRT